MEAALFGRWLYFISGTSCVSCLLEEVTRRELCTVVLRADIILMRRWAGDNMCHVVSAVHLTCRPILFVTLLDY